MASQPIYQLYAELLDYQPRMWRRFQVLNNINMSRLGYILMTMFEMQASHLFCFDVSVAENYRKCIGAYHDNEINGKVIDIFSERPELARLRIELPSGEEKLWFEGRIMDAAKTKVKNVLEYEEAEMTFSYDFGDGWTITLKLEKIFEDKNLLGKELPRVLEGEGYGIIEDCGGPGGLEDIAEAFTKKKGKKYEDFCEWLGIEKLDLSAFDINDMNFRLKKIPRIYADAYEYNLEPTEQSINLLMRNYKKP